MTRTVIICAAAALMPALLAFEKQGHPARVLAAKTPLSALFLLAAITSPVVNAAYFRFLVTGLGFCLAGDVCLALPRARMFLWGLIAFLCGHVMYVGGFFNLSGVNRWSFGGALIALPAAVGVYHWLKPHLGALRLPVLFYITVITVMLAGACGVAADSRLSPETRALVLGGAVCFYLSDLFVARQRFVCPSFFNRLAGLPLYYLGQFMLALSAGAVGISQ
jgi:uncharacterized membrane protein YhhN